MNPIYTILESPHRWLILAGLSFGAGSVGAIMFMAFGWPHMLDRIWFYAGFLVAVGLLVRALLDWKAQSEVDPGMTRRREVMRRGRRPAR